MFQTRTQNFLKKENIICTDTNQSMNQSIKNRRLYYIHELLYIPIGDCDYLT